MYGLILENIAGYLRNHYGNKVWEEIKYVSGVEEDAFLPFEIYSEGIVHKLVWAAQDVTASPLDEMMEAIGYTFYDFTSGYEYHKILRVLGRRFTDFLNGLDNLHEYLRFTYPKLKPPSFYCEHESRTGLTLHYRSKRRGYLHYVKGIIKCIGKQLFDTDVKIELLDHENEDNMEHIILRLHYNNMDFGQKNQGEAENEDLIRAMIKITSDIFFDIFPFIIVFNRGMRVRNMGLALMRVMPRLVGKRVNHEFVLMRPLIKFRWEELMLHSNNVFELMSVEPVWEDGSNYVFRAGDAKELEEERRRMTDEQMLSFLTLKGQMIYMEEWESICFLGIPVMSHLRQMYGIGLFINDFAMHDSSRDLVLASTQQAAELKLLLDQEAQKGDKLKDSMTKLKKVRERTDELLYQMLPRAVADELRKGVSAVATCESFENVTLLFTDVVGFTTICASIAPMAVVQLLNQMYSVFDGLTEQHGVFKVETIGDAYMISGGAPVKNEYHGEYVCDCALAIISAVKHMVEQTTKKQIQIRAGTKKLLAPFGHDICAIGDTSGKEPWEFHSISFGYVYCSFGPHLKKRQRTVCVAESGCHSGPVVAGVVGLQMPRYCLFGDTVMIANKMESTGEPMKIQISQTTKNEIEKHNAKLFKTTAKGNFETPDRKQLKTYFLDGKNGRPRTPPPIEEVNEEAENEEEDEHHDYTPVSEAEIDRFSHAGSVAN